MVDVEEEGLRVILIGQIMRRVSPRFATLLHHPVGWSW